MFHIIPRRVQWATANRAYLETLSQDAEVLLVAADKLLALTITAEKSALKDSVAQAKLLLDVKNARELGALRRQAGHPGFEKTVTYGCVLYDLMAQIQTQVWRLAELRFRNLDEILAQPHAKFTNPDNSVPNTGQDVTRSFIAFAHFSLGAMKNAGQHFAAMMERNVGAMTIATVKLNNIAQKCDGVFFPGPP